MDGNSNFRSFSMPCDPKSWKTILRIHGLQDARTRKMIQTLQGAPLTFFGRLRKFSTTFPTKKVLSEMEKYGKAIFYSRPRMKVESTPENSRNTSNTGSKQCVWLLVRRIHGVASEIQMLSVEAVWVMPSVTSCHTLSAPICEAKPNISDGGTSRYNFAASLLGKNPRKKDVLYDKFVQNFSWLVRICQRHDKKQD